MSTADFRSLITTCDEDGSPVNVDTQGNVPNWLNGSFLRVGPGKFELGDFQMNHWLDGYALLSRFQISDGKVNFYRKFLQSDALKRSEAAKKPVLTELGTRSFPDPNKNMFSRFVSSIIPIDFTDNCVANVYTLQGDVIAATETCFVRKVDPETLLSPEKIDLWKHVGVNLASCKPRVMPDGTAYNVGTSLIKGLKYVIYKIPPTKPTSGKDASSLMAGVSVLASVSPSWKGSFSYYHSFVVSEHYVIIVEQALLISSMKLLSSQAKGKSFLECFDWTPTEKCKFLIVDRETGQKVKTTYIADTFFFLNAVNAYEEDGHLVVDILAYKSGEMLKNFYLETLRDKYPSDDPAVYKRFVLPLNVSNSENDVNLVKLPQSRAEAVKQKDGSIFLTPDVILQEQDFELPTINPAFVGKKNRYVYGTGFFTSGFFRNALTKVDLETKQVQLYRHGDYDFPGQPVFVQSPNAQDEDDGVILGTMSNSQGQGDTMFVLDAKTFTEIARAPVSQRIPLCFSSTFVPKS